MALYSITQPENYQQNDQKKDSANHHIKMRSERGARLANWQIARRSSEAAYVYFADV